MNRMLRNRAMQALSCLIELAAFFPVILAGSFLLEGAPSPMTWTALLALDYMIGLAIAFLLPSRRTFLLLVPAALLAGAVTLLLPVEGLTLQVACGLGIAAAGRGVVLGRHEWDHVFADLYLWLGIGLYLAAPIVYHFLGLPASYSLQLTWVGAFYLAVFFFGINWMQLKKASLSTRRKPVLSSTIVRNNAYLLGGSLGIIFLTANIRYIRDLLIGLLIVGPSNLKLNIRGNNSDGFFRGGGLDFKELQPRAPAKPSSTFDQFLEKLFFYLGMAFLLLAVLTVLFMVGKGIYKLIRWYFRGRTRMEREEGYIDLEEDIPMSSNLEESGRSRIRRPKEPKWRELADNRDRIRYLYRRALNRAVVKGNELKPDWTPMETGRRLSRQDYFAERGVNRLTELYDRARYGDKRITDEEVGQSLHWKKE